MLKGKNGLLKQSELKDLSVLTPEVIGRDRNRLSPYAFLLYEKRALYNLCFFPWVGGKNEK